MRWIIGLVMLAGCTSTPGLVPSSPEGRWVVDLSTEPGQPYTKVMELKLGTDGTVAGSFYDSEILAGRWKTSRGRTCVSFRTTDGAGLYHSAACLAEGDTMQGQTWAEHRSFLFNWNAVRQTSASAP